MILHTYLSPRSYSTLGNTRILVPTHRSISSHFNCLLMQLRKTNLLLQPSLQSDTGRRSRSGRSGCRRTNIRPTNPRKNAVWGLVGSIVALKVATLEGTSDDSCHPPDFCWGWRKAHFVAWRKSPSKRKFWETTLTIDRGRWACPRTLCARIVL